MAETAEVVVIGAGIAGAAAAYHLAARRRVARVTLIDEREPLTLTSDKGTQGYRNWWPGPDATMLRYMTRSIDLLEEMAAESGNSFRLNRRGYVFLTADDEGVERLRATAREVSAFGMGELRGHGAGAPDYRPAPPEGYQDLPNGADLVDGETARHVFPGLARDVRAALHVRRAGWLNAIALGAWMLKRAFGAGATFMHDRVIGIDQDGGRVRRVRLASGAAIDTDRVAIAAGPCLPDVVRMLGLELPIFHELHAKLTLRDTRHVVSRAMPFMIWNDPIQVEWSAEERASLADDENAGRLFATFPGGVHVRPIDGPHGDEIYVIWTFDIERRPFAWPPRFDRHYAELCVRGLVRMMPGASAYYGMGSRALVDGGYYCKTEENRPVIGPLPVEGAYVLGALSGYGVMGSHAGAELLAAHLTSNRLPDYARWFLPSRYDDPAYRKEVERWGANVGQL